MAVPVLVQLEVEDQAEIRKRVRKPSGGRMEGAYAGGPLRLQVKEDAMALGERDQRLLVGRRERREDSQYQRFCGIGAVIAGGKLDLRQAIAYRQAVDVRRSLDDVRGVALSLARVSHAAASQGEWEIAAESAAEAAGIWRQLTEADSYRPSPAH